MSINKSRQRRVYHQFRKELYIIKSVRFVYHQAAGGYTLTRDEIQGRLAALDDIRMYISPQASYTFNDMPILRLG